MVAAFSAPILSVAADAVRDLEGHDALFGLWTVFTKCKTSLPNGARLENITWRLWHCELKAPVLRNSSQFTKESDSADAIRPLEKSSYRPLPPSASTAISPTHTSPANPTQYSMVSEDVVYSSPEALPSPIYSLSSPTENATRAASNSRRSRRTSRAVGRIICDFLPTNRDPSVDQPSSVDHRTDVSPATIYQSIPKTAFRACNPLYPSTVTFPAVRTPSCLPTPDMERLEPSITRTATQSPSQLLTAGPAADSTPGLLSEPPRLVVVNATPNPTPHPTPPTTPHVRNTVTAMQGTRSLWLTPLRLASDSVTQPRNERGTAVGNPDHADIWTQPMSDHDLCHDHADGLSASSIASKSSEYSHTTNSVAGASTTSASSTGYLHDEGEKPSHLIGTSTVNTHVVGNLPLPALQRPGSLSTIQSTSTDQGRREAVPSSDIGDEMRDGSSGMVTAVEDEDEQEVSHGKGKRSTRSRSKFSSKKRVKRNSAPVSLTPIPCSHVDQTPHHSLAVPISTEHPTTTKSTSARPTNSNPVMDLEASYNRSPSQSRSRESSAKGSRSRSREPSGNPFADLSGIGTLGGYTIAAAYPPPNMTVRKQVAVGAGKGKVKLAFGRGNSGKSKAVRRNSAGSATDVSAKEKDKGGSGSAAKLERVKSEEYKQSRLEGILEKPTLDQRIEKLPQVALRLEGTPAKQRISETTLAQPKRYNEFLTTGDPIQSVRRQPRFNIGSNSDDGSGVASKGSSQTGGHSLGQQARKMMEDEVRVMNEKALDALLLQAQDRQRQDGAKSEIQQQSKPPNTHAEVLQPTVPLQKPTKHETRHSKATLPPSNSVLGHVQSSSRVSEKGKGRSKALDHHLAMPPSLKPSSKTKSKSTPNLGSMDAALAAKVRDSLGQPLLPKGRTVVVDTESEYETETDDGTWSDEDITHESGAQKRELTLERERERKAAELQEQELLLQQIYLQQQLLPNHQHHGARPTAVQRTHSSHFPAPNNARTTKAPAQRHRHQQIRELALHHAKLEQAAKEAQRQREMIQKLPRESFQDLAKARANSVGLLTQLLNPNPEVPPRNRYSSGALAMQLAPSDPGPSATLNAVGRVPPKDLSQQSTQARQAELTRPRAPRRHASTDEGGRRMPSLTKIASPIWGPLKLTKSSAALPVSSQVQAGRVIANGGPSAAVASSRILNPTLTVAGGYRHKGPPKGQEMEEDSDSELETEKIQISKSIAEQKLKSLAEKRGIRHQQVVAQPQRHPQPAAGPSRVLPPPPGDEDVPDWVRVSQPHRQQEHQLRHVNGLQITPLVQPPPSVPIPLHPYNLPLPAPPTTPRTTRRQMLSTELSESLRRNLLWERQVSKNNLAAMRRSSSGGVNQHDGLGRLQPFTTIAPVVQLHAKGTIPLDQQEDPAKRAGGPVTEAEREVMRKHAVARNRSWANEFHYAGW